MSFWQYGLVAYSGWVPVEDESTISMVNFHLRNEQTGQVVRKYVQDFAPQRYGQLLRIEFASCLWGARGRTFLTNSRGHIVNELHPAYIAAMELVYFGSADEDIDPDSLEDADIEMDLEEYLSSEELCLEWFRESRKTDEQRVGWRAAQVEYTSWNEAREIALNTARGSIPSPGR